MPTFARIDASGYAIDVYDAPDTLTLEKRLGVTGFVPVPDGTKNHAAVTLDSKGAVASVTAAALPVGPSANEIKIADLKQQLAALDTKLERRDEDFWRYIIAIGAAQVPSIPPPDYIKKVLADKDAARTALQDLGG